MFSCIDCNRVIIKNCNEPHRNVADGSQQNECDKQPWALHKFDEFYNHFPSFCSAFWHQQAFITVC